MAMTSGNNGEGRNADMNVTPLIDVLLVLLIIFMIITPIEPRGLDAMIPQPATDQKPSVADPRTIIVQLLPSESGQPVLKINRDDVTWSDLQPRLTEIFKLRAERVAFVQAADSTDFEYVARVIDAAHASGIVNVGLITARMQGA